MGLFLGRIFTIAIHIVADDKFFSLKSILFYERGKCIYVSRGHDIAVTELLRFLVCDKMWCMELLRLNPSS